MAQAHDISDLYGLFGRRAPEAVVVPRAAVPQPQRALLDHEDHMTVTLEAHHGGAVDVEVLDRVAYDGRYARRILLRRATGPGRGRSSSLAAIVMFGIVLIDFRFATEAARREILSEATPLGHVLIRHSRLRRISTHCLLEIEPDGEMRRHFGLGDQVDRGGVLVHGRLATIFCDEQPAVELLEVVPPGPAAAASPK
jgi:chorismate-pyruvate lyase